MLDAQFLGGAHAILQETVKWEGDRVADSSCFRRAQLPPIDPALKLALRRTVLHLLEVRDDELRHFLSKVECGSEIAADKAHVTGDVLRELRFASLVREQAVHLDLGGTSDRGDLPLFLAALLEPVDVTVKDYQVGGAGCGGVAVAVHVLELV